LLANWGNPQICSRSVRELMEEVRPDLHSKKPDETYRRIEQLAGDVPRLEIFSRQAYPKWAAIGNEIDGLDITESIERLLTDPAYLENVTNKSEAIRPGKNLSPESLAYYRAQGYLIPGQLEEAA
jgi:hypothetical protein